MTIKQEQPALTAPVKRAQKSTTVIKIQIVYYYYLFYYAVMAAKQRVQYKHKHANTSTRKTQKDIKKICNQQSYQQTDETGCSGKAVGTVNGREASG